MIVSRSFSVIFLSSLDIHQCSCTFNVQYKDFFQHTIDTFIREVFHSKITKSHRIAAI